MMTGFPNRIVKLAGIAGALAAVICVATGARAQTTEETRAYRSVRHMTGISSRVGRATGLNATSRTRTANGNTSRTSKTASQKTNPRGPFQAALDQVGLTAAERDQIAPLDAKADTDGKAAYDDRKLNADQFRAKMDQIQTDHRKAVEDVLTPGQRTKLVSLLGASK